MFGASGQSLKLIYQGTMVRQLKPTLCAACSKTGNERTSMRRLTEDEKVLAVLYFVGMLSLVSRGRKEKDR